MISIKPLDIEIWCKPIISFPLWGGWRFGLVRYDSDRRFFVGTFKVIFSRP